MTARRLWCALLVVPFLLLAAAGTASAHPLGNFTINHYDGLQLHAGRVDDVAVVDTAEIPTLQERSLVDTDADGQVSDGERSAHAASTCRELATGLDARLDGRRLSWSVTSSAFGYRAGAAQLQVSRLECGLSAPARLDRDAQLSFTDGYLADRLGWREITASGDEVQLIRSPVPAASVSDELRAYPNDLLSSPLVVRSAALTTKPGAGLSTFGAAANLPVAGPVARALNHLQVRFNDVAGAEHLTLAVGLLAVLLSLVLGASHAAMPGHGKTVIAAYLAGQRGSFRDALTVGATVTVTHTAGVIVLGLLLSAVATLAGDQVLAYLGLVSGLLIASIGVGLLRSALRQRRSDRADRPAATLTRNPGAGDEVVPADPEVPQRPLVAALVGDPSGHVDPAGHGGPGSDHVLVVPVPAAAHGHGHGHGHGDGHGHGHVVSAETVERMEAKGPLGRATLVGMGVAGGLVPSPSALVVLLGAISLGRTAFGLLLVLCYGIGMAGTLTAVGLLLVRLRGRLDAGLAGRFGRVSERYTVLVPVLTATLVLTVGLGLALRALYPLVLT